MTGVDHVAATLGGRARVFDGVIGQTGVEALLAHVVARRDAFTPADVYRRASGSTATETDTRDCLRLKDLGLGREPFAEAVAARAADAAAAFGLFERDLAAAEFELCAYGDGGRFAPHVDVVPPPAATRVMTCVYYFSRTPAPFTGGGLRLFAWPGATERDPIDIEPICDRLVMFPSFLKHEVLPVALDSDDWLDRRFNLTCWLCRPWAGNAA